MKANTTELVKFKKLQRRLGESVRGVIGILELLWKATALQAPRGDIGKFDNEDIAILCDWEGEPDLLVNALVASGWLDESAEYRLLVHDWHEHAPNYVRAGLKAKHQTFLTLLTEAIAPEGAPDRAPDRAPEEAPGEAQLSEPSTEGPSSRARVLPSQVKSSQVKSSECTRTPVEKLMDELVVPAEWMSHPRLGQVIPRWVAWVLRLQQGDAGAAKMQLEAQFFDAAGKMLSGKSKDDFAAAINLSISKDGVVPYWEDFSKANGRSSSRASPSDEEAQRRLQEQRDRDVKVY